MFQNPSWPNVISLKDDQINSVRKLFMKAPPKDSTTYISITDSLKDQKVGLALLLARTPKNYEVNSETWDSC
jgi:hypothetical protein